MGELVSGNSNQSETGEKNNTVPQGVIEEFEGHFANWKFGMRQGEVNDDFLNTGSISDCKSPNWYWFSKGTKSYFQSLKPLTLEDVERMAKIIGEKTGTFRESEEKDKKDWIQFIRDSIEQRMNHTGFEKMGALYDKVSKRVTAIFQ